VTEPVRHEGKSGPCIICGRYLHANTGQHQQGRAVYARIEGKTVRVGAACARHFKGKRVRDFPYARFIDPYSVELLRDTEPGAMHGTTDDRPSHRAKQ
jgi:hypothetical protein